MAVVKETDNYRIIVPDYLESNESNNESVLDHDEQSESMVESGTSEEQNEDTQTEEIEEETVTDYTDSLDTIIINQETIIELLNATQEQNDTIIEYMQITTSGVHFITNLSVVITVCFTAVAISKIFKSLF